MAEVPGTPDTSTVESSTTIPADPHEAPLPEGTKEETAKRFQELLADRKAKAEELERYKSLGTPEDIATIREQAFAVETLQGRIQELEAARNPGQQKTAEQQELEAVYKKAWAELCKINPNLAKLDLILQRLEAQDVQAGQYRESLNVLADKATADLLKEEGLVNSPENVDRWGRRLLPFIQDDAKLRAKFFGGDPAGAVKAAWEQMHEEVGQQAERKAKAKMQQSKEKLTGLPRPHTGPGGPASQSTEAPKDVRAGVERAMARLGGTKG